jgi:hypothetical protein
MANLFLRTGGFVAVGLVSKRWSLEECSQNFHHLCRQIFSRHNLRKFPKISWRRGKYAMVKYGSRVLEESLKELFTHNQPLFGNSIASDLATNSPRVIIPTSSSDGRTIVFANYSRQSSSKGM